MEFGFAERKERGTASAINKNPRTHSPSPTLWSSILTELKRPTTAVLCLTIVTLSVGYLDLSATWNASIVPFRRKLNMLTTENGVIWSDSRHLQAADALYKVWSDMYGLSEKTPPSQLLPPEDVWEGEGGHLPSPLPVPPHLQDCVSLTDKRTQLEERGANGEDPLWLQDRGSGPQPPWIRGPDSSLLPHTRRVQSLIWQRQHPIGCRPNMRDPSVRFALVQWGHPHTHGMGSALHVMSQVLAFVMKSGRVLVPDNNFARAMHQWCEGADHGNFECYFFPLTDPECKKFAYEILESQSEADQLENLNLTLTERLNSDTRVIKITNLWLPWYNMWSPPDLEIAWKETEVNMEVFGKVPKVTDSLDSGEYGPKTMWIDFVKAGWWRAQCVRYFLRHPSRNMCHAVNQLRHEVYGMETARGIIESVKQLRFAVKQSSILDQQEGAFLENIELGTDTLDNSVWKEDEPYLPRPMVSLHVRQSDKQSEMHLFSVGAYMWLAARLKRRVPNIQNVWLTTETKAVIEQSKRFYGWKFYHGKNEGKGRFAENEENMDFDKVVKEVFANWLIASECDRFIGPLASNFYRVINELRLTNGRLHAGVLAVNFDEC